MCALSSSSRGAMLGRQYNPTDVIRGLLNPASQRNLSVAYVLHADKKTVCERKSFFTRIRDIFKKSTDKTLDIDYHQKKEDKSYNMIDAAIISRAAAATKLHDHPKIATSKQLTQDFSSKVDVVNQRPSNFSMAQSMIKPEGTRFNRNDFDSTSAIQQSQFSCVETKEACKHEKNLDPSEKKDSSSSSITELTTNNDTDYRYYANLRHCYRLPLETKHEAFMLNRNITIPSRTVMDFAPRNTKPPIREPDMPVKRDEKKDKKDKKKPIIRTDRETDDSNESQEGMEAKDNPKSDPDTAVRYEWGVKLNEESNVATRDNDNFTEKNQRYVTKRLWGVNLKQSEPDVEDVTLSTSADSKRRTDEYQNISKSSREMGNTVSQTSKESGESNLRYTTAGYLSTSSNQRNIPLVQRDTYDVNSSFLSSEDLWRMIKMSPETLTEMTVTDGDYNVPQGAAINAEITAWKSLTLRSKKPIILEKEESLLDGDIENLEMMSIRPEAPQPKLDVQVVKSVRDEGQNVTKSMKTLNAKDGFVKMQNIDIKKLHTTTTTTVQIRYIHRDVNAVNQPETIAYVSSILLDNFMHKQPEISRSVVSTNPKNPIWERMIDEIPNQQGNEQSNLKYHHGEKFNGLDAGDTLRDTESSLLMMSQTSSSNNTITNKKIKLSLDQSQYANYQETDHQWNTMEYLENSYINDNNNNISLKSHVNAEINMTNEDIKKQKDINFKSNLKENLNTKYIIESRENLDKWHVPRSKNPIYKPIKHNMSLREIVAAPSFLRETNNTYVNAAGELDDSHAATVIETSGSNNDVNAKNTQETKRFNVSSQDQRVVIDYLLDDVTNALGHQRWSERFSRLNGTNVNKKMDNAKRDN